MRYYEDYELTVLTVMQSTYLTILTIMHQTQYLCSFDSTAGASTHVTVDLTGSKETAVNRLCLHRHRLDPWSC